MGKVYQFPYNSAQLRQLIRQAEENEDYVASYHYAKLLFQETDDLEVLHLVSFFANKIGAYDEALTLMDDRIEAVLSHERLSKQYCQLLMASGQTETALEIATVLQEGNRSDPEWATLIDDIQAVSTLRRYDQVDMADLNQQLRRLHSLEQPHQLEVISQAHLLSSDTLLNLAPAILTATDLSQLVKTSFIQVLLQKNCKETLDLYWHGQERQIVLATLDVFEEAPLSQEIIHQLDHQLMDYPNQRQVIIQEAVFHLMQLYPFVGEVIQDIDHWVLLYQQKFIQHTFLTAENEQQNQQKKWFNKLIAII